MPDNFGKPSILPMNQKELDDLAKSAGVDRMILDLPSGLREAIEEMDKLRSEEPEPDPNACKHSKHMPTFDEEAAKGLDEYEVRKRWPRFQGTCSECGDLVILYASWMHYIMGDW